jgi:hypothetical protein
MHTDSTLAPQAVPHEHATETFEAPFSVADDALALLDHRLRSSAVPAELAAPGRYLAIEGGGETLLLRLESDVTHIGRGFTAELRLDDDRISRRHAIVAQRGAHVHVLDDRSANGTFVNGRRIVGERLADGDIIRVGPVALRYVEIPDGPTGW